MIALDYDSEPLRLNNKTRLILVQRLGVLLEIIIRHVRHLRMNGESQNRVD